MRFHLSKLLDFFSSLRIAPAAKEFPAIKIESNLDIILLLASREKPFTQTEVSKFLQIDKSQMEILIKGLEQHRYIYTERNMGDSGQRLIFLTYLGKEFVPAIHSAISK